MLQAHRETTGRLKLLQTSKDELAKFEDEQDKFDTWLEHAEDDLRAAQRSGGDLQQIDRQQQKHQTFCEDVIAHQADLRFITMSATKFMDEAKVGTQFQSIARLFIYFILFLGEQLHTDMPFICF